MLVEKKNGKSVFNSSSPDELALINGAKYFGYQFLGRDEDNNIMVVHNGVVKTY